MLRSNLSNYSNVYIVVKGRIGARGTNDSNKRNEKVTFKNNPPFRSSISKISNTFADNAEDLDIIVPVCVLLEYSDNYSMTSGCLWDCYGDKLNDSAIENDDGNKINNKTMKS